MHVSPVMCCLRELGVRLARDECNGPEYHHFLLEAVGLRDIRKDSYKRDLRGAA